MRLAMLLAIGCAAQRAPVDEPEALPPLPPLATFRWAQNPVACSDDGRSSIDTCEHRQNLRETELVAVYAPTDDTSLLVAIRYEGPIGAPLRWQQRLDVGPEPHSAVVTVVREAAIVAAISKGAARVVAVDNVRGRILGTQTIVATGARSVQLEAVDDFVRVHVRTASGGVVAVMHPRTSRVITRREVGERSIFEHDVGMPDATESIDEVALGWESGRLVLRRGTLWKKYLRMVHVPDDQRLYRGMLRRSGETLLVTVHDTETGRIDVYGFDRASGAQRWRSALTSNPRRIPGVIVRAAVDDDQLVVAGDVEAERFTCSVGIADGVERACVERFTPFEPVDNP